MKLLRSKGFSLIQVMIAAGIAGMISVVLMKIMDNTQKQMNYIDFKLAVNDIKKEIGYHLSFRENCIETFDEKQFDPINLLNSPLRLDRIKSSTGKTLVKEGQKYQNNLIVKTIELKRFTPSSKENKHQGIAELGLVLEAKKNVLGPSAILRTMRLEMTFGRNTSEVVHCSSLSDASASSSTNSLFRTICQKALGSFSSPNRCTFNNPALPQLKTSYRILGSTNANTSTYRSIPQVASKNAAAFCGILFGPSSFALSYYEAFEGGQNKQYLGTNSNDQQFRLLNSGSGSEPLLDKIICSQ